MDKIRYGVLSTANIMPRFVNAVKDSINGEVVAVASRSLEKAEEKALELSIPTSYGSYEELVADPNVDVVYIPTVNALHYDHIMLSLSAGKHVVCEKPFVMTKKQAEGVFRFAKEKGLFLMEAQKSVFLPVTQEIREIIQSGDLGTVWLLDYMQSATGFIQGWFQEKKMGGGALYGSSSYPIEHARFIMGEDIVDYQGMGTFGDGEVDLQCAMSMRMEGGALLTSRISTIVDTPNLTTIVGEKGRIEITEFWKARKATVSFNTGEKREIDYPVKHEMVYEVDHINECIAKGLLQSPVMDEKMTIATCAITEEIVSSWGR